MRRGKGVDKAEIAFVTNVGTVKKEVNNEMWEKVEGPPDKVSKIRLEKGVELDNLNVVNEYEESNANRSNELTKMFVDFFSEFEEEKPDDLNWADDDF